MAHRHARGQIELARVFRALLEQDDTLRGGRWTRGRRRAVRTTDVSRRLGRDSSAMRFDSWNTRKSPLRSWLWSSVFGAIGAAGRGGRHASRATRRGESRA